MIAPILFGLDKFFDSMVDWTDYDVALRDVGLLIGALALARLAWSGAGRPAPAEAPLDAPRATRDLVGSR